MPAAPRTRPVYHKRLLADSMTVSGIERLAYILTNSPPKATKILAGALYAEALEIFNESQRLVPVATGNLRATGHVTPPEYHSSTHVSVTIGYGGPAAPYAIWVHERIYAPSGTMIRHRRPTTAKFLERPALSHVSVIDDHLTRRVLGHLLAEPGYQATPPNLNPPSSGHQGDDD